MLKSVQAGRGLAALAVAAFHLSFTLGRSEMFGWPVLGKLTWRGDLGVDFFFVLSGFIIVFIHHRDIGHPERFAGYLAKRAIRLYPAYWLYLAGVCGLLAGGVGNAAHLPRSAGEWFSTISLVRVIEFAPPILPAWTLFHEVSFYAVFGILILSRRAGLAVIAAIAVFTVAVFEYPPDAVRGPFIDYASAYNLDFLIGIGAFYLVRDAAKTVLRAALWLGLALFCATLTAEAQGNECVAYPLIYALAFGGILAGAVSWERGTNRRVSFGPLAFLGDASYSIYLTHEALESGLAKMAMKTALPGYVGSYGLYLLIYVVAIAGGCVAYVVLEKPMLQFLRRQIATAPRATSEAKRA